MQPDAFKAWLSSYTDADRCLEAFRNQKQFFRVNTLKIPIEKFLAISKLKYKKTACPEAFESEEEKGYSLGRTWEYFFGYIHPQSLSSILVSLVLDSKLQDTVLDACASPGSKFSHLAARKENKGILVGNDQKEQIAALYATINRLNVLNGIVTMRDTAGLNWKERFTKILLDAPCTALGSAEGAMQRWKAGDSIQLARVQKKMLFSAYDALKPGGVLVYSTCTYPKEENEEVVANLLENVTTARLESIEVDVPHDPGLSEYGNEFRKCYRIYPPHLQSEGFFIAKIKKEE